MTPASIAEARARVQQHAQDVLADLSRGDDEAALNDACALLMDAYDLRHSAETRRDALRTLAELAVEEEHGLEHISAPIARVMDDLKTKVKG